MSKRKPHDNACHQELKKSKNDAPPEQVANTDWDINSYRSHYEPEEHWELRRRFMESHQNWIAEDDLVCLAQLFVNVELLHCRYPLETMERIKELSKGIADEYRDSRKNKLQRTFVSASDAAASKVQRKGPGEQVPQRNVAEQAMASRKHKPVQPIRTIEDVYNNIVLMNNDYEQTQIEFDRLGRDKMIIVFSKNPQGKTIGEVKVGQFSLAKTEADGEKSARKAVKLEFLQLMTQHCYAIIRKKRPTQLTNTNVERKQVEGAVDHRGRKVVQDYQEKKIDESNLGFKLLQKLGWSGGSLGSKNQGIVDPINCQIKIGRQGLGGGPAAKKQGEETSKKGKINTRNETYGIDINFYRQMMRNFRDSEIEYDLVFSNEFTKEERALFHNMAQQLQLKTRSYGNDNDGSRQFVLLGRKVPPHELLERVLVQQDPIFCEMYNAEPPKGIQKDEPTNLLQDETDQPQPAEMNQPTAENLLNKGINNNQPQPQLMLNHEFMPIVPIQTLEDLHNNIVLVDRNFIQTKREFELLQCGKLEVLVTSLENKPSMFQAKVQVGAFVLVETKAIGRKGAKVAAQRRFMEEMGNWCYRIIRQKKSALIAKAISDHQPNVNDYKDKQINDTNLGFKMLVKQGWRGGALGPTEDGLIEPIACQKGFQGFDQHRTKQFVARKQDSEFDIEHYMQIIQDFRDGGEGIADALQLKSRSYGNKQKGRQLLFHGKQLSMHGILQRVLVQKDSFISEMYKVQLPKRKFE